jgi:hypothetical protein
MNFLLPHRYSPYFADIIDPTSLKSENVLYNTGFKLMDDKSKMYKETIGDAIAQNRQHLLRPRRISNSSWNKHLTKHRTKTRIFPSTMVTDDGRWLSVNIDGIEYPGCPEQNEPQGNSDLMVLSEVSRAQNGQVYFANAVSQVSRKCFF